MRTQSEFPVLTVAEMQAAEQAIFDTGVSVSQLMQRAGTAAAEQIWRIGGIRPTTVLCGPGNNGGDGYVIAECLRRKGVPVHVVAATPPKTEAAQIAASRYAGTVQTPNKAEPAEQFVDCLFGSGLSRSVDTDMWDLLSVLHANARRTFSIDLPSGVESDSAALLNLVPDYDVVLALGAWKFAHKLMPAAATMRQTMLIDIGTECAGHGVYPIAPPCVAPPAIDSHKYQRGLVAIVAGAMPGAAILAGMAAQSAGAGYVKLFGAGPPPANLPADLVWTDTTEQAALVDALADDRISVLLVGPGLGRDGEAKARFAAARASGKPMVVDADALHLWNCEDALPSDHQVVMTPHDGEFAALSAATATAVDGINKVDNARHLSRALNAVIVHKGPDTVVATPDSEARVADRASSWLSVAGTGDVLAGTIAARLAISGDGFEAACTGQALHSQAARLAGPAFSASDLAHSIRDAVQAVL